MAGLCIIVPVYNAEKYVGECIESILHQTYSSFRLVLVNDGSEDSSLEICKAYAENDERVIVISQENKGAAAARNCGLEFALHEEQAEYVGFVDSDDLLHAEYIERLYGAIDSTHCRISMCNAVRSSSRNYFFDRVAGAVEVHSPEYMWCHDRNLCVVPWGKLYDASLFETIRFPENARAAEDEFVSYRVLFACNQISYINLKLYSYFQSENSIMRSEWTPKRMAGLDALDEQLGFFYKNGYRNALHESANTYVYLINDYIKRINASSRKKEYREHHNTLSHLLKKGVKQYFREYRFPVQGNEWVLGLLHPHIARVLIHLHKLKRKKQNPFE